MFSWSSAAVDFLWQNALTAFPLVVLVAAACRWLPCRASTKHCLWLLALLCFVLPPLLPRGGMVQLLTAALPGSSRSLDRPPADSPPYSDDRLVVETPTKRGQRLRNTQRPRSSDRDPARESSLRPARQRSQARGSAADRDSPDSTGRAWDRSLASPAVGSAEARRPGRSTAHQPPRIRAVPRRAPTAVPGARTSPDDRSFTWLEVPPARPGAAPGGAAAAGARPQPSKADGQRSIDDALVVRTAAPEPPAAASPRSAWSSRWLGSWASLKRQTASWAGKLDQLRRAVIDLPRLPTNLWLGGVAVLLGVSLVRHRRVQRFAHHFLPAPQAVTREVAAAARQLKLKRLPETSMVRQRISPMILCGRRARLILPVSLWSQLDRIGRHAVLCHELAHLKRRDHWVCWADWLIGLACWWNPLVWWVRQQLKEEAELCCDQWVTWLLPRNRRAYAEALLMARTYTSRSEPPAPLLSIGATSQRSRRFARRITMIMTVTNTPRLTTTGIVLAFALAASGWVTGPLWACPPKEKAAKKAAAKAPKDTGAVSTFEAHLAAKAEAKTKHHVKGVHKHEHKGDCDKPCDKPCDQAKALYHTALEKGPLGMSLVYARGGDDDDDDDEDDDRWERRMERMEREMERLSERLDRQMKRLAERLERMTDRGRQFFKDTPPSPPRPPEPPSPFRGDTITRSYHLPEGKLQALTALMVRDDIPVLVSPHDDRIEVHGTERQHAVFKAFVIAIAADAEDRVEKYHLPSGKLEALSELMIRSDVPILVTPHEDYIEVHGNGMVQSMFRAFVNIIHPGAAPDVGAWAPPIPGWQEVPAAPRAAPRAEPSAAMGQLWLESLSRLQSLESAAQTFERQARELEHHTQRLELQANVLDEKADLLHEQAESLEGDAKELAHREARQLTAQMRAIEDQARAMEREAELAEERAEALKEAAESLQEKTALR